jgi:hypothetical protein
VVAALLLLLFTSEKFTQQKAKGNVLHWVGTHNAKSMTEKNGGNTTGEVPCGGLCDCGTEQAVLVRWRGVGFSFLV